MSDNIVVQKLKKNYEFKYKRAYTYYSIINSLNNFNLTKKQLEVLTYTAIRGTISSLSAKNDFIKNYGSSIDSINNIISKLYKKKLLIKVDGKIKVNHVILPDLNSEEIVLNINLNLLNKENV